MGNLQYIKNKPRDLLSTKTQEISFPDEMFAMAMETDNVYVIECYDFHPIKIIYNGEKIKIKFVYENEGENEIEVYKLLRGKYIKSFSKIVHMFENTPFVIFGDFFPNDKIVIFDMFINDNWFCYEDLCNLALVTNLEVPKTLYHGLFDETVIKKIMKSINSEAFKGERIKYAFIKSEMEARYGAREYRLGALISTWTKPKNKKEKKDIENKAKNIIISYLSSEMGAPIVTKWKKYLESKNIPIVSKNKNTILSEIVNWMLFEIETDIFQLSEKHNIEQEVIKNAVKSSLPKFIIKMFDL